MALAQAQLLRTFQGRNTPDDNPFLGFCAQSYWVNQKVLLGQLFGAQWGIGAFRTFDTGVIVNSNTGDAQPLSVSIPATQESYQLVESSLQYGLVWEVTIVQFDALAKAVLPVIPNVTVNDNLPIFDGGDLYDTDEYTILSRFYGEVVSANSDTVSLQLELGSSISPVGSQVPPRKFLSSLVGAPLRL